MSLSILNRQMDNIYVSNTYYFVPSETRTPQPAPGNVFGKHELKSFHGTACLYLRCGNWSGNRIPRNIPLKMINSFPIKWHKPICSLPRSFALLKDVLAKLMSIARWNRHVLVALNFVSCDWWFQPAKAPREMLVIGCFLDVFGCVIFKLRLLEQHGTKSIRWQQPWQSSIVSLTVNLKPWSGSLEYPLRDMNPRITSAQDMGCIQLGTAPKRYVM